MTTDLFWDCECKENYIHPQARKHCEKCGVLEEDMPSARITEVLQHAKELSLSPELIVLLKLQLDQFQEFIDPY